jgi:hypothetical protein
MVALWRTLLLRAPAGALWPAPDLGHLVCSQKPVGVAATRVVARFRSVAAASAFLRRAPLPPLAHGWTTGEQFRCRSRPSAQHPRRERPNRVATRTDSSRKRKCTFALLKRFWAAPRESVQSRVAT